MKYVEWLEEWLNSCVKPLVKVRTLEKYERNVRTKIIPALGNYELNELSAPVLQKFTADLVSKYSPNTVMGVFSVLNASLKQAVMMGLTERQYTSNILRPKVEERSIVCFSKDEQKKLESYILESGKQKYIGILISLYTGIRIGELLALKWNDIDFQKDMLSVTKSCHDNWDGNGYHKIIEKPKTKSSIRLIPIPRQLMPYIKKIKKLTPEEYVVNGRNQLVSVRAYQRSFEVLLKKLGIEHKGFHSLRHTFATRALECGMDVKTLSEILGHKNATVTLNRYAHSLMEHKSAMMNKVGKLLQEKTAV